MSNEHIDAKGDEHLEQPYDTTSAAVLNYDPSRVVNILMRKEVDKNMVLAT